MSFKNKYRNFLSDSHFLPKTDRDLIEIIEEISKETKTALDWFPFPDYHYSTVETGLRSIETIQNNLYFYSNYTDAEFEQVYFEIISQFEKIFVELSGLEEASIIASYEKTAWLSVFSILQSFHVEHKSYRKWIALTEPHDKNSTLLEVISQLGYTPLHLPTYKKGKTIFSLEKVLSYFEKQGREIAALLVSSPNHYGFLEPDLIPICQKANELGIQIIQNGHTADFLFGTLKPKNIGVDLILYPLHLYFGFPPSRGTNQAYAIAVRHHLSNFLASPRFRKKNEKWEMEWKEEFIPFIPLSFRFSTSLRCLVFFLQLGMEQISSLSRDKWIHLSYLRSQKEGTENPNPSLLQKFPLLQSARILNKLV